MKKKLDLTNIWVVTILLNICSALWGSAFPCIKIGYEWLNISGTSNQIVFAGMRFMLAGIQLFLFYMVIHGKMCRMDRALVPKICKLAVMQTFIQYVFFYIGMSNTTGVKGSIINSANSFFTILLAHFLMKNKNDRMEWKKAIGCLMGVAGIIMVNAGGDLGGSMTLNGEGFVLLASLASALAANMSKNLTEGEDPVRLTCYNFLIGGLGLFVVGLLMGGKIPAFDGKSLILLFYMGLISAGAFSVRTLLLKYNPVGRVAIFGFMIPVYGCLFSSIFLGETFFKWSNLAALALVCLGIVIVNYHPKRVNVL